MLILAMNRFFPKGRQLGLIPRSTRLHVKVAKTAKTKWLMKLKVFQKGFCGTLYLQTYSKL